MKIYNNPRYYHFGKYYIPEMADELPKSNEITQAVFVVPVITHRRKKNTTVAT